MLRFVDTVSAAGADRFVLHARKAWLSGLSPKQNRTLPPLPYELLHRLKRERPKLAIEINGGLDSLEAVHEQIERVDGEMVGRAAYEHPYAFARADRELFGDRSVVPSRREIVERMIRYAEEQRRRDVHLGKITRHMLGLFTG
jgi:tRNA-dihydrouridine synthase A